MMEKIRIEETQLIDASTILNLYKDVAEQSGGIIRHTEEITGDYVEEFINKSLYRGVSLVAKNGDELIGEIHAYSPDIYAFQHLFTNMSLVIDPDYQGKGIGKRLLKEFLKTIENRFTDILRVELFTREQNIKNVSFYEKMGFVNEGRQENKIFISENELETPVQMAWFNKNYKFKKERMKNIVLFGPPGAGKGTQAEVLKEKYRLVHISTGDVFRYNIKNETELGTLAKSYMDKGHLVPDEVTINMLNAEVEKNADANGFIFDGFPRTEAQAIALAKLMDEKESQINAMVALEVDDEVLVGRLLERGKSSGRADDANEEVIRERIAEYYRKTDILKNYYQKQDKYYGVDGVGSIEEITERLSDVIDTL
jgi:adenylate kinase